VCERETRRASEKARQRERAEEREIMCVSRLQMVRSNEVCCPLPLVTKNSIYKDKESVHKRERVCVRVRTSTYGFSSTNTSRSEASLCVRVCVVCV